MSDQNNKLTLTVSALKAPANLAGVFELEPFQNNFVKNLVKTSGMPEEGALMKFEREKILFMKAISANKELEKCDRFTIYSAFIELAVSGLSLLDGETYIIPYGGKAQFQVGYKGRVNQMNTLPGIVHVNMPQVVYDCDEFDYELGEFPKVIKHKPHKRTKENLLTHVYIVVEREPTPSNPRAKDVYIMDRIEVLAIRDRYSQSYRNYVADCKKLNKEIGSTFKKSLERKDGSGSFDIWVEPPMWITSEEEAWKKTIVKRAYKWVPKTARLKALDAKIAANVDPETGEVESETIDYGILNEDGTTDHVNGSPRPDAPADQQKPAQETPAAQAPAKTRRGKKDADRPKETPTAAADIDAIAAGQEDEGAGDTQDVDHSEVNEEGKDKPGTPDLGNPLEGF